MLALHRSFDGDNSAGERLPSVYKALDAADIHFTRSTVAMTVGRPGGGKSIFGLDHAIKCGEPTVYISCDMSRFALAVRAAAILTGEPTHSVESSITSASGKERYRVALKKADHMFLAFEKRPDADALEDVFEAFTERWGVPPKLCVVDNLMNLLPQAMDEWSGLREMSHVLDYFAAESGACVHVLHHINLAGQPLDRPAPLNAVKGQVVELPSLILSVSKTAEEFRFAAVKNRNGREDPMAQSYGTLDLDPGTLSLSDPLPKIAAPAYWGGNWGMEYAAGEAA